MTKSTRTVAKTLHEPAANLDDEELNSILVQIGPPPPLNRSSIKKLNKKHQNWLLEFLAQIPSPKLAAQILGTSVSALYHMRNTVPDYRRRYGEAMAAGRENVASLAWEEMAGIGFDHQVVVTNNQPHVIAVKKKRSEKLLAMALKMQHPEIFFHNTVDLNTNQLPPGTMTIAVTPEQLQRLTRDERKTLTQLLAKLESFAPKTINGEAHSHASNGALTCES